MFKDHHCLCPPSGQYNTFPPHLHSRPTLLIVIQEFMVTLFVIYFLLLLLLRSVLIYVYQKVYLFVAIFLTIACGFLLLPSGSVSISLSYILLLPLPLGSVSNKFSWALFVFKKLLSLHDGLLRIQI